MKIDLLVQPAGKATAKTILTQAQVDAIRGKPGRGRVNLILRYGEHSFRTCVTIYGGHWMFVINRAMRDAGLVPGASYPVELIRDDEPRRAEPAPDVLRALAADDEASAGWDQLSTSRKRQHLQLIEGAKRAETRQRRIAKMLVELRG